MSGLTLNKEALAALIPGVGKARIWVNSAGEPQLTDGDTGLTVPFRGSFGSNYGYAENEIPATNNTTEFQNYLTLPYSGIDISPGTLYRVSSFFVWGYSTGTRDYRGQFTVNGIQVGEEFRAEPKDSGTNQRIWANGFAVISGADLGASGFISYNWAAELAGDVATTYLARLELFRVA